MIIVEGIDRVGKTTLVNLLREKTSLPVLADNYIYDCTGMRSDSRVNMEKIQTIINMARDINGDFIVDRLHWSEYVYGVLDRKYDFWKEIKLLEKQLVELDAKIILVAPTDVKESSKQHGKDLSQHDKFFEDLFENTKLKKFRCTYDELEDAVDWVVKEYGFK